MSHGNDEVRFFIHETLAMRALESDRLVLRKFSQDDLKDIVTWEERPAEQCTFEAQAFLDFCIQSYSKWGMGPWAMFHKEDQKVVGNCGFCRIDLKTIIGEVNYCVAKQYRNQGLASEALQLVIMFGFQDLSLAEIRAKYVVTNDYLLLASLIGAGAAHAVAGGFLIGAGLASGPVGWFVLVPTGYALFAVGTGLGVEGLEYGLHHDFINPADPFGPPIPGGPTFPPSRNPECGQQ
jgi:[ribosomal protein S5]-alanine N-acetyltransferase